ncbi:hypothetical protein FQR65_LT13077 [Abscondita terminalis]|nr:hypothetical protein FQR65_LT13077 [Abscondita terminalis]
MCLILVNKIKYARASVNTWAKHCNHVELVQLKRNKLGLKRNKDEASWPLLCNALVNISESFHWILVVKETTFAIVENVRHLVAPLDYESHYYLGHAIKFWGIKYNVAQAGYILSNGTLAALKLKNEKDLCSTNSVVWNLEDYYLGRTLQQFNISVTDTRDELGFAIFHGYNLQKLFFPGSTTLSNYYKHSVYPTICCSPKSVTFQVSNRHSMYTYEYLLNQLQIFKNGTLGNHRPVPISQEEVWQTVLRKHSRTNFNMSAEEYYDFWVELVSDPVSFAQKIKDNK